MRINGVCFYMCREMNERDGKRGRRRCVVSCVDEMKWVYIYSHAKLRSIWMLTMMSEMCYLNTVLLIFKGLSCVPVCTH